jgi:hypothetical protein
MSRIQNLSAIRNLLVLLLAASAVSVSCTKDKSTDPGSDNPVPDWWTVDDCEGNALYSFTGTMWTNMQPVFRFSTTFPESWRGEAEGAASVWNSVGSRLQIMIDRTPVQGTVARDGMSVLSSGVIAEQPTALGVTYCWVQGTTQTEVDIVISSQAPITIGGSASSYDLRSVLTHEFGHFCGLGDLPTMKHTMSAEQHLDSRIYWTLCPGDQMGLLQLYP